MRSSLPLLGLALWIRLGTVGLPAANAQGPVIDVSPAAIDFGDLRVGGSATADVYVSNVGPTGFDLWVNDVILLGGGAGYGIVSGPSLPIVLAPGEPPAVWTIQAQPPAVGQHDDTLYVASDALEGNATVALTGRGLEPLVFFSPTSVSFGDVGVGQAGDESVSILNLDYVWADSLTVTAIDIASGDAPQFSFDPVALPQRLAPGEELLLMVHGQPTSPGLKSSTLLVTSDAANDPQGAVSLSMTGVEVTEAGPGSAKSGSRLHPAAPSIFRDGTVLAFEVSHRAPVVLDVYDVRGRLIRRLMDGWSAGEGVHRVWWDGRGDDGSVVASGVYCVALSAAGRVHVTRIVRVR